MLPPVSWTRPVCLMADEIQMVRDSQETKELLVALHDGNHGLPIVPLFAGLGSSFDVLRERGLSRLGIDAVHDIGALAPAEVCEAVDLMLDAYRVDVSSAGDPDWPLRLQQCSENWPQHLHNGMRALARGLVEAGGRLAAVDAGMVDEIEQAYRAKSYERRVSPAMRRSRCLVGAVMDSIPEGGLDDSGVLRTISHFAQTGEDADPAWSLPRGMDRDALLDHLVHQGALQGAPKEPEDRFRYHCPIPSFRTYLVERGKSREVFSSGGR